MKYENEVKRIMAITQRFELGDSRGRMEDEISKVLIDFAIQLGVEISSLENEFEDWWACYPLKTGKKAARKSYGRGVKDVMKTNKCCQNDAVDFLKAKAIAYAKLFPVSKQYCRHATTWLNQGNYFDEDMPIDPVKVPTTNYRFLR